MKQYTLPNTAPSSHLLQSGSIATGIERSLPHLLASSLTARNVRLSAGDMLSTEEAATLIGTSRVTVNAWIKKGRAIGLSQTTRGFKLPIWQFEPTTWSALPDIVAALGCKDGWEVLAFLETPVGGLDGFTPRMALEQGLVDRVLKLAAAEGT